MGVETRDQQYSRQLDDAIVAAQKAMTATANALKGKRSQGSTRKEVNDMLDRIFVRIKQVDMAVAQLREARMKYIHGS